MASWHMSFICSAILLCLFRATFAQQLCNGYAALCDRQYSNVSFIGTHDSAFAGPLPQDNQNVNITDQLNAGIRYLQAQVHDFLGVLQMCHTSCLELDTGTLTDYLSSITTFLDSNPNEVISLLLVNGDNSNISLFAESFDFSGLQGYAFIPSSSPLPINNWPTLSELIAQGTQLVAFIHTGADSTAYPFILDEFSYYFETPYDVVDTSIFGQCTVDRPAGATPAGRMSIANHFRDVDILGIDIPDRPAADQTNAAEGPNSIGEQADACVQATGRWPNCVLVDYFDQCGLSDDISWIFY